MFCLSTLGAEIRLSFCAFHSVGFQGREKAARSESGYVMVPKQIIEG